MKEVEEISIENMKKTRRPRRTINRGLTSSNNERNKYCIHVPRSIDSIRHMQASCRRNRTAKNMLSRAKCQANKKEFLFNLDLEWAIRELSKGYCPRTGYMFEYKTYRQGDRGRPHPHAPSIDRIDSNLGYTKENCQIVVWAYNRAKSNLPSADLFNMSRAIVTREVCRLAISFVKKTWGVLSRCVCNQHMPHSS